LSILARRVRLTCKISQDDVPDSADLEIFFEVFWRGCRIVSLLGYPEKTDRLEQRQRRGNPGRFLLFLEWSY